MYYYNLCRIVDFIAIITYGSCHNYFCDCSFSIAIEVFEADIVVITIIVFVDISALVAVIILITTIVIIAVIFYM